MHEVIIGLEVHCSLNTKTKLFCPCAIPEEGDEANTKTCNICVGFPGSKPALNKKAVAYALKLALALNCKITKELIFSRKSYFYPDVAKNYQTTQYEIPLGSKGNLNIGSKKIGITRIHIEEDPAALVHQGSLVLVDYNRSGKPLCEIVTEPEFTSPDEAREFLKRLITILHYLEIFDVNKGVIKADANISIKGYERAEIKNITGFKEIERALNYEIERQKVLIREHQGLKHRETRGWDAEKGITLFQRRKEEEQDYGYILDTDLVPIDLTKEMIDEAKHSLPELPQEKVVRYQKEYTLKIEDAEVLANDFILAKLFEHSLSKIEPGFAAEWIRREVSRVLNYKKKELEESFIEKHLLEVLELIQNKKITRQTGQRLMELLVQEDVPVKEYVHKNNLELISDDSFLEGVCKNVLASNAKAIEEYKRGEEKSYNFLVGQVMRASKGKADPQKVHEILKKLL